MGTTRGIVRFGAVAALSLLPSLALAGAQQAASCPPAARPATSQLRRGPNYAINQDFVQDVGNNCQFRSSVRGTVQEWHASTSATRQQSRFFLPDLSVASNTTCAGQPSSASTVRTLRGTPLTTAQLNQSLSERGTISSVSGNHACTFNPQFAFRDGTISNPSVTSACQILMPPPAARGGGPIECAPQQQGGHHRHHHGQQAQAQQQCE